MKIKRNVGNMKTKAALPLGFTSKRAPNCKEIMMIIVQSEGKGGWVIITVQERK